MGGGLGCGGLLFNSKCGCCCGVFCCRVWIDLFFVLIVIGVVIGFVIGVFVNGLVNKIEDFEDKRIVLILIGFLGELFMNMFKMLIFLLIVVSFICVLVVLDVKVIGFVGRWVFVYYFFIIILVVIFGIVFVVSIWLGSFILDKVNKDVKFYRMLDVFLDFVRWVFFRL